jgi:predicted nucleotide-binding protein (sugar kinase/HSP70/actin superfamily)
MSDTDRKTITDYKYICADDFIRPTVKQMAEYLKTLEEQGWDVLKYDNDDNDVALAQRRLETDEEYNHRIAMEKDANDRAKVHKARDRESRYQNYLKLKEEFGE